LSVAYPIEETLSLMRHTPGITTGTANAAGGSERLSVEQVARAAQAGLSPTTTSQPALCREGSNDEYITAAHRFGTAVRPGISAQQSGL